MLHTIKVAYFVMGCSVGKLLHPFLLQEAQAMDKKIRSPEQGSCYLTLKNAQNHRRTGRFEVWTGLFLGESSVHEIGFALLNPLPRRIDKSDGMESDLAIAIGLPFGCREQALEHGRRVAQAISLLHKRIEQSDAMPQREASDRMAALINQLSRVGGTYL